MCLAACEPRPSLREDAAARQLFAAPPGTLVPIRAHSRVGEWVHRQSCYQLLLTRSYNACDADPSYPISGTSSQDHKRVRTRAELRFCSDVPIRTHSWAGSEAEILARSRLVHPVHGPVSLDIRARSVYHFHKPKRVQLVHDRHEAIPARGRWHSRHHHHRSVSDVRPWPRVGRRAVGAPSASSCARRLSRHCGSTSWTGCPRSPNRRRRNRRPRGRLDR